MPVVSRLRNAIQEYEWGSRTAIAGLLGLPSPSARPQAELWMGAHPKAPSTALDAPGAPSLLEMIERDPAAMLGPEASRRFGGRLPFLFKVLAAARPLSIQAHPGLAQAKAGFADEKARAVPEAQRTYVDDNHKPEILCALTPFHALSGFRGVREIKELMTAFGLSAALPGDPASVSELYRSLLALSASEKKSAVQRLEMAARGTAASRPEAPWVLKALAAYPGDFGALSILCLNLVALAPGEALYQDAGVLHAYLEGTGIELMANSDNVLRGGLTTKPIDTGGLMSVVSFESAPPRRVTAVQRADGEQVYPTPAPEFRLSRLPLRGRWTPRERSGIELWIMTEGNARLRAAGGELALSSGESFVVPADAGDYALEGSAVLYRAAVPPAGVA
jgi:mannose-6-phosphate isomerase